MRLVSFALSCCLVACLGDASTSGAGAGGLGGAGGAGGSDGGGGGAGAAAGAAGAGGAGGVGGLGGGGGGGAPLPAFDDAPWETGDAVGFGVAFKDTGSAAGEHVFLAYAGYGIPLDAAESWAKALWEADLAARGVRYVFAIQGPASPGYEGLEIGNSKVAAWLVANLAPGAWVAAAGHSSGSYVAQELFGQLAGAADPDGVTAERVVYFSLDGGYGLSAPAADRLRAIHFVGALDGDTGTSSPNRAVMQSMAQTLAPQGALYWELDATGSGCDAGAAWCVHMTPINALPHDPTGGDVSDYLDFVGHPVTTQWLVANAQAAGLLP